MPCTPGLSQMPKKAWPSPSLNGIAVAISPCREYAVADTIVAFIGVAKATTRAPYAVTGCNISTVPLPSVTLTYDTSAWTGPYWASTGRMPTSANATGSCWGLSSGAIAVIAFSRAGPERYISWSIAVAPPAPGLPATSCQYLPLIVPDAISPVGEPRPGGCTVTV